MYARLFFILVPFFFIACSSVERKPDCIQSENSPEVKCEQGKAPETRVIRGDRRERP